LEKNFTRDLISYSTVQFLGGSAELAFRSGLHRTYVGSVERGERNLSLENIFVFAKALFCDASDLIPKL
jgi:transcriptional regulator with XRE-family HTH domain